MPEFCTCGAQLPPDARFCHKCGKPQYDYPGVGEEEPVPVVAVPVPPPLPKAPTEISFGNGTAVRSGFLSALIAVLLVILFSKPFPFSLPVAFLAAGFLAVFLYIRRTGQSLSLRSGARIGWITGIFAFIIFTFQLTVGVVASSSEGGVANVLKSQLPPNDARTEQILQVIQEPSSLAIFMLMMLIVLFIILTVLPTLGGVLGAKLLTREH